MSFCKTLCHTWHFRMSFVTFDCGNLLCSATIVNIHNDLDHTCFTMWSLSYVILENSLPHMAWLDFSMSFVCFDCGNLLCSATIVNIHNDLDHPCSFTMWSLSYVILENSLPHTWLDFSMSFICFDCGKLLCFTTIVKIHNDLEHGLTLV